MVIEKQPQRHEFWLPDLILGDRDKIYRIALGKLINASERETFKPGGKDFNFSTKSGSIGFIDVVIRQERIPKEDALPYPNPNGIRSLEHVYSASDYETKKTIVILTIGIEPHHRKKGFARLLKQRVEEIALTWGLDTIVADQIENPVMKELNIKLGYTLFDNGRKAVKRLTFGDGHQKA